MRVDRGARPAFGAAAYSIGTPAIGALVVLIPGWETVAGGMRSTARRTPNMDALIAIGTLASLATGVVSALHEIGIGPAFVSFAGVGGHRRCASIGRPGGRLITKIVEFKV